MHAFRKHSPHGVARARWRTPGSAYYLIYRPRKDERPSWPSWLTYSGRFYPHKWSPVSYRSRAGQGKFAGQSPAFYHCATQTTSTVKQLNTLKHRKAKIKIWKNTHIQKHPLDVWKKTSQTGRVSAAVLKCCKLYEKLHLKACNGWSLKIWNYSSGVRHDKASAVIGLYTK